MREGTMNDRFDQLRKSINADAESEDCTYCETEPPSVHACVRAHVRVCVRACMHACVPRACLRACMRRASERACVRACVFASLRDRYRHDAHAGNAELDEDLERVGERPEEEDEQRVQREDRDGAGRLEHACRLDGEEDIDDGEEDVEKVDVHQNEPRMRVLE